MSTNSDWGNGIKFSEDNQHEEIPDRKNKFKSSKTEVKQITINQFIRHDIFVHNCDGALKNDEMMEKILNSHLEHVYSIISDYQFSTDHFLFNGLVPQPAEYQFSNEQFQPAFSANVPDFQTFFTQPESQSSTDQFQPAFAANVQDFQTFTQPEQQSSTDQFQSAFAANVQSQSTIDPDVLNIVNDFMHFRI
ncbi:hypothetical protein C1645_847406 [Glomus cerebriforme]|uniref:Uncharacterized protein n=1 Tax=Glomus cerebriforme TaxID=658196 RepID=A0A397T2I7_9GLOM|nr:hypothetical protein C1645_847406 [Glomus cerebriforme]